jgi:primosomal replication protein N''
MTAVPVRRCPQCGSQRPASEIACENEWNGSQCRWSLIDVPFQAVGESLSVSTAGPGTQLRCPNEHPMDAGDVLCLVCGVRIATGQGERALVSASNHLRLPGWRVIATLPRPTSRVERVVVESETGEQTRRGLAWIYDCGMEPDPSIYPAIQRLPALHVPTLIAFGTMENRAYEIWEPVDAPHLGEAAEVSLGSPHEVREFVARIGQALAALAEAGLRHRDIRPEYLLVRSVHPLDIVLTGFGSARLSEFDLDVAPRIDPSRYAAPEAIVGTVSPASDWWSLGVILIERLTSGACFRGVSERAFLLHVVTRGIAVPPDIDPDVRTLLRGLLTRDPARRWQWHEVRRWVDGEAVEAPMEAANDSASEHGPTIGLGGAIYRSRAAFAVAAAEPEHWEEACELMARGSVATWLEHSDTDARMVAAVRTFATDESLDSDTRLALALMAINANMPLCLRGDVVTPNWLLAHPAVGYELLMGRAIEHLRQMDREQWLVRLRDRAGMVRARAESLEIEVDEERLRAALLCSSGNALEAEWNRIRRLFPDTDHAGLASLIDRRVRQDEDLVVLVGAAVTGFTSAATVLDAAAATAARANVAGFAREDAASWLERSRREIYEELDRRLQGFARCGIPDVDAWADAYRVERRMELARALVLFAVPTTAWSAPPRQEYIRQLLGFFERRVAASVQQGPLVRLTISRMSSRIDLTELGSTQCPSSAILERLLERSDVPLEIDSAVFHEEPTRESRLRRLAAYATVFRRDTGMNGLYLGFPFLVYREAAARTPRIAPVLLWPIRLEAVTGGRGRVRVAFDREREEIRLNPALEGIIGADAAVRWGEAADEVRGRSTVRCADVMDVFGVLARPAGRTLKPLPSRDVVVTAGMAEIYCAAVLFHSDFSGQGVAEDLRSIARRPVAGTALEVALRVSTEPPPSPKAERASEIDRYLVVESDPSQELAVFAARRAPGLLIEGPPGTGKSQTIVNVIADCIGRQQSVLVVCQKQAALRVVEKRLNAEGLEGRLFVVTDVNEARTPVLRALREQLDRLRRNETRVQEVARGRGAVAARIETIETLLNRQHAAAQTLDGPSGVTFCGLLAELIALESGAPPIAVPHLRSVLGGLSRSDVGAIEDECEPLASLWLAARYEGSPLVALKSFATDVALIKLLSDLFGVLVDAEEHRDKVLGAGEAIEVDDPAPHQAWLRTYESMFRAMAEPTRRNLSSWLGVFRPMLGGQSAGSRIVVRLETAREGLEKLEPFGDDWTLADALAQMPASDLERWLEWADVAVSTPSFFGRFKLRRFVARRRLGQWLRQIGRGASDGQLAAIRDRARLDARLRPVRALVTESRRALGIAPSQSRPERAAELFESIMGLLADLKPVEVAAAAVYSYPEPNPAVAFAGAGTSSAFDEFVHQVHRGIARYAARHASLARLKALEEWLVVEGAATLCERIIGNQGNHDVIKRIADALPTLSAYQRFRIRASELMPTTLATFAVLRSVEAALESVAAPRLAAEVRRTIGREARIAWKARMETDEPALVVESDEIESRIAALTSEDAKLRRLNKDLLASDPASTEVAAPSEWEDLTRLRGPRARRLREVIERGVDLGLLKLRPVWLMNPDVASRLLPLRPLFDVVIFDEASQLPVEWAVPAMYRARRVIVSGDEKQMPPTSFFQGRIGSDEVGDFDDEEISEGVTEAERVELEEAWNRREIKDCPDLLTLARAVLPSTMLEIHYRSKYRELIAFSNAAFYGGRLNVPARHPDDEVRRVKPITVVKSATPYSDQTNPGEAGRVVETVADLWRGRGARQRRSIGVVTFNRRQADLIDDLVEARAEEDAEFRHVLGEELERSENGEDMGFFVKNLENVQGDERDVIIFSTTFGRDAGGAFRRTFGVLGQRGGERRLNVAITRARERVILVSSLPVREISDLFSTDRAPRTPRDYLQAYMDYATKLSDGELELARALADRLSPSAERGHSPRENPPDGFVADVEAFIRRLGYKPTRGTESQAFAVDFTIVDSRTGLFGIAIDCDAPRHVLLATARAREVWRPFVLGKAIPRLHRVSSQRWYHDREIEQRRLADAIGEALGTGGTV